MKVISKQDIFISTTDGICARVTANEPRELSQEAGLLALQQGAEQYHEVVHGKAAQAKAEPAEVVAEETTPDPVADPQIVKIIADIVERGDPKDLTPQSKVKAAVIDSWLGRKSTPVERDLAWQAYTTSRG